MREFDTCGVAAITQQSLPFPTHFPLVNAHQANSSYRRQCYQRLQPDVWPEVLCRARTESLRQLAAAYGVSLETIRRIMPTEREGKEPVASRGSCVERLGAHAPGNAWISFQLTCNTR